MSELYHIPPLYALSQSNYSPISIRKCIDLIIPLKTISTHAFMTLAYASLYHTPTLHTPTLR